MRPRQAAYIALPGAVVAGAALAFFTAERGDEVSDPAPRRCAALAEDEDLAARTLELSPSADEITLGVVADARGASEATLSGLRAARDAFEIRGVDIVLALGGMARERGELEALYTILAEDAPWTTIASPGDRESLAAHRAAIVAVAGDRGASGAGTGGEGAPGMIDGSATRLVVAGPAAIATLPGAGHPSRAIAGEEGCVFDEADADALAAKLRERAAGDPEWEGRGLVWASHPPPRQRGDGASDRVGGVHMGNRGLAGAARAAGAGAIVHGRVDEAALKPASGVRALAGGEAIWGLAAGPAEALPVYGEREVGGAMGTALVVTLSSSELAWERLELLSPPEHQDLTDRAAPAPSGPGAAAQPPGGAEAGEALPAGGEPAP